MVRERAASRGRRVASRVRQSGWTVVGRNDRDVPAAARGGSCRSAAASRRAADRAVSDALAKIATRAGATIRTNARVARITARDGHVTGVVLEAGDEIPARVVASAVDPRQTFLKLADPADLPPTFVDRIRNYRARGVTAKINLALDRAPVFKAFDGDVVPPGGDSSWRRTSTTSNARSTRPNTENLGRSVARALDSEHHGSVAGARGTARDVHLFPLRAAPSPGRVLGRSSGASVSGGDARAGTARPRSAVLVSTCQVLTPEDLEQTWGLSGGPHLSR